MINFGCDYYPEQWAQWLPEGEARWETDAQLMADAGFNVVRLAEFAWGLLEPAQDIFDFTWLDRAIAVLHRHGLRVVLCTPTAAPPPWLLTAYPDITQVTATGVRMGAGTRREACANHPLFRQRSRIITERLASHYADHPAVIGWQTDNEFGCHDSSRCYCGHCEAAFRSWLQSRYLDIELLNDAWGGSFWGEIYTDWSMIPTPNQSAAERSPSHLLDYFRFSSDSWRDYQAMEIEILRRSCPNHFITHNLMGFFSQLDYYDLSEKLDFVSWDNYHYHGATPGVIAASHDHMWGILQRNFWVMEQQVGQINWSVYNPVPPPNFVRLKTYQGIAHGADGIVYFRWRQALAGSEQYHSGLLDHAGRLTMGYHEAKAIGAELKQLAPLLEGTRPRARVAILLDYESRWTLQLQRVNQALNAHPPSDQVSSSPALRVDRDDRRTQAPMVGNVHQAWPFLAPYIALWERNVGATFVSPESDLSQYAVVIAPFLNLVSASVAENLRRYVEQGGALILGPRCGVKDESNRLFVTPPPGPLADLAGVTVRFFDSLEPERLNTLRWSTVHNAHRTEIGLWAEVLDANGADVLATYAQGWYANEAAITHRKAAGGGHVVYVGCMGGPDLYDDLLAWLLPQVGVAPVLTTVPGVEACARVTADGRRLIFLINHGGQTQHLSLSQPITDVLTGEQHERSLTLPPGCVVVYAAE